ncbi:MAG TPA: porin, partial [Rhodobacterales bacterium]|nr:porin [Rhodobacterales bacterium]
MKKILLATSILVGTDGVVAADVSIFGGARFGVGGSGGVWALTNRFTLKFDGSGETDGGLSYGGRVRLRA